MKEEPGFYEEARGANTWLVVPNDEGAFDGVEFVDEIRCVHPVQAYVDLKDHPERASAAAEALRRPPRRCGGGFSCGETMISKPLTGDGYGIDQSGFVHRT